MLAAADHVKSPQNMLLKARKDLSDAIETRQLRQRNGQFRVLGVLEAIIFEPDQAFDPELAPSDAKHVGRRLYWPEGGGPWLARSIPEGFLMFTAHLRLPLPDVPDVARDDPKRLPIGDNSDPTKPGIWKPGDPVNSVPMMKQRMERVASAKFGPYLVFQPVAQIQFLMGGRRQSRVPQHGGILVGGGNVGHAECAAAGSHRTPLSSLGGDTVMALLIDPKNGEALFVGGRESVSGNTVIDRKG
jgi:hypothetical protein